MVNQFRIGIILVFFSGIGFLLLLPTSPGWVSISHVIADVRRQNTFTANGEVPALDATQSMTNTTFFPLIFREPKLFLPLLLRLPANFPTEPWPADGAQGQSLNAFLRWQIADPDGQTVRYALYLEANDTTPDELIQSDLTATAYDPFTFALDTQYYWQVVVLGADGAQLRGPVWAFRTEGIIDPPDVEAMITIPAGEFRMGCDRNNRPAAGCVNKYKDIPLHTVYLDTYEIDKYEVTNKQYRSCVEAGKCRRPRRYNSHYRKSYFTNPEFDYFPMLYVSWWDGQDYCAWKGKRLPTEAEWEKAARGPIDTRSWPWGQEAPDCSRLNFQNVDSNGERIVCVGDTARVGNYPTGASPYGVMDVAGNAFEWVADIWNQEYYAISPYANPTGPEGSKEMHDKPYFALRGGSYRPNWWYPRVFHRHYGHHGDTVDGDRPFFRNDQVGFRCARSLEN